MILDYEKIKEITFGAAEVCETLCGVRFYRMNGEELALYRRLDPNDFAIKALTSSGIRLGFVTDSTKLAFEMELVRAGGRKYYSVDVTVDGKYIGSMDNFDPKYKHPISMMEFEREIKACSFDLGEGEKEVSIYLPWTVWVALRRLELDDGATVKAAPRAKKMLVYGDSITQGYDAARPTCKYITRVAAKLGAEEYNKAIGGEIFIPELSEIKQDFTPDLITVAYGTNDWGKDRELDDFVARCKQFYTNLRKNYPDTPIYAITPIWRYGGEEVRKIGSTRDVGRIIGECVDGLGITVIDGYGLVPEDRSLYADHRLHPNDEGFVYYAEGILAAIKKS
jgi:lysophospholipase L1-like esterase